MLLLSAIIAIIFCWECVGCKKDQGQYYELDDDCSKVYICKQCDDGWWFLQAMIIYDCYLRRDRDNPGDCKTKGYVNIQSEKCVQRKCEDEKKKER
ncbi:hypothetical protein U3516DRAFT_733015 [Neocallimastix sp. 'constans']